VGPGSAYLSNTSFRAVAVVGEESRQYIAQAADVHKARLCASFPSKHLIRPKDRCPARQEGTESAC
jgi:hypothetical protein